MGASAVAAVDAGAVGSDALGRTSAGRPPEPGRGGVAERSGERTLPTMHS
jgi:hypothetical protein